jgi:hypothetical protein
MGNFIQPIHNVTTLKYKRMKRSMALSTMVFQTFNAFWILSIFLTFLLSVNWASACTVFVVTDGKHTHFFNNEDFTNPNTRIWFVPKGNGYFGGAYLGFNDGEPQGGFNTEGLAFDWVTVDTDSYGVDPNYVPEKNLLRIEGNSGQWMLERCKTVEEAIKFYQKYREPAFAKTTLVIADQSGASVVIGSKNGKLYFDTAVKSRGLGYGEDTFKRLYKPGSVDVSEGTQILKQCLAPGNGGTKYSNSYDLKSGDIDFFSFTNKNGQAKLNLIEELKKGSHYYEISELATQTKEAMRPLQLNMNRNILFDYKLLPDQEPKVTAEIKNLFSEVTNGKLKHDDLSEKLSNNLKQNDAGVKSMVEQLGKLNSAELIYKTKNQQFTEYSYIIKFEKVRILWQFLLDDKNKIQDFNTLSAFWTR